MSYHVMVFVEQGRGVKVASLPLLQAWQLASRSRHRVFIVGRSGALLHDNESHRAGGEGLEPST